MHDVLKQFGYLLCGCSGEWFIFDPLGELINGDIYVFEASQSWLERSDHVQSPACEGPRCRDGLKGLCWRMYLLGEKLATLAAPNERLSICHGGWPIKTSSESLDDQISRGYMVAT